MVDKPLAQRLNTLIAKGFSIALRRRVPSSKRRQFYNACITLSPAPFRTLVLGYHISIGSFAKVPQQKDYKSPPRRLRWRTHPRVEDRVLHRNGSLEKPHVMESVVMLDAIHKFERALFGKPRPGVASRDKVVALCLRHSGLWPDEPVRRIPSTVAVPFYSSKYNGFQTLFPQV
jgi:hypothetical protein